MQPHEREPICSIEVEQAFLGALLIDNNVLHRVADVLEAEHFFEDVHRHLFEIAASLIRAGKLANPVTMKIFVPADAKVGDLTVSQYIARLVAESTGTLTARQYAETIRDLADRRRIVSVGDMLAGEHGHRTAEELAAGAIAELDEIVASNVNTAAPTVKMSEAATRAVDAIATAYQNEGKIIGIPSGLRDLDAKLLGIHRGELFIMAGRPGMGKTALALTVTRNVARQGYRCHFFSLEMGDVSLTQRMLADEMYEYTPPRGRALTYSTMRSGRFEPAEFGRIVDAGKRLEALPIVIEQQPQMPLSQIAARARQRKRRDGLDVVVVDHIGLVRPSGRYAGNMVNEIGEITGGLKALAKELGVAVIALCQLSRGVEGREDKRPGMADLRASGNIEQDADVILMLYRELYYLQRKEPKAGTPEFLVWQDQMEKAFNRLDLIVEKQRNGPTGTIQAFVDIGCNAVRDQDFRMAHPLGTSEQELLDFAR